MQLQLLTATAALGLLLPLAPPRQSDARRQHIQATELMLERGGDAELRRYAQEHLAPAYRAGFDHEAALLAHLRGLREAVAPVGAVELTAVDDVVRLHVHNASRVSIVALRFESSADARIASIELESSEPKAQGPRLDWESLASAFEDAADEGFSGSVLALRAGEVVLERGFGHADVERRHPVTPQTLFAIGSTPIDFTHGALLLLEQSGQLSLDDTLPVFFDDVPADKRSITLEQLRTGRSGLLDFPGIPGVDENLDLSWIDRAEFLRRVLGSQLVFAPGSDERHSHCAWGVLAAVIEVASGQDYESFLREHFFAPAGMQRTGHYPHSKAFPSAEVAVGLGGNVWGEVNSPQYWGPTSWLVLGSGGMVSTPGDLRRWRDFLRGGDVLGPRAQGLYGLGGVSVGEGGNDRGFVTTIGSRGGDLVIVCSNSALSPGDASTRLALAAARLAAGG